MYGLQLFFLWFLTKFYYDVARQVSKLHISAKSHNNYGSVSELRECNLKKKKKKKKNFDF